MRKMNQDNKKKILRICILIMAIVMLLSFVLLPLTQMVSADEAEGNVTVTSFETGKLAEAIEKAKDGTDLNLIKKIAVSGGTLNAADYSAICGYPNIEYLELAGCDTEKGVIPENALPSRNQLTYVSLPKNTETIGARAFSGNRTLLKISIPSTLRHIEEYAFEGCENVEEFSVPAELETLGTGAFSDCKALKSFALPEAITEIPDYCFSKASLTEMHFGPQITSVGNGAFSDCHDLTDIYFYGTDAPSAPESAFQNLKVTIHTYEDGKGFDSLNSNFVSIAYDLSEDSKYIPPKSAEPSSKPAAEQTAAGTEEAAEDKNDDDADPEATEEDDGSDASDDEAVQADVTVSSEAQTSPSSPSEPAQSGFSGISVIVIAVLCVIVGVLGALVAVKSKKN